MGSGGAPTAYRVVGVDPGIANLGLGAVEEVGKDLHYLASSLVRTSSRAAAGARLTTIKGAVSAFIDRYQPAALAIEGQYFHHQRDVAFRVGQAVGVVLLLAAERELRVFEYGPMAVKQALVGTGGADKAQVAFMVRALLQLPKQPGTSHEADALALALTHLQSRRLAAAATRGNGTQGA